MVYEDEARTLIGKTIRMVQVLGDSDPQQLVLMFDDGTHATVRVSTISKMLTLDLYGKT